MSASVYLTDFHNPARGSDAHRALCRAEESKVEIYFIGKYEAATECFFRVQRKGGDSHVVVLWLDGLSDEPLLRCDCPGFNRPQEPRFCLHVAGVAKQELERAKRLTSELPRKLASMGRREPNETCITQ